MPIRSALIVALTLALLAGCGDGGGSGSTPSLTSTATETVRPMRTPRSLPSTSPTATLQQTPTGPPPTRTPTPVVFTYRLTEGSTILSSPAPSGSSGPVLEEPLSGRFIAETRLRWECFYPNSLLCFAVTTLQFQSAHFTVNGTTGRIIQSTFNPAAISLGLTMLINGQPLILNGGGPFDADAVNPPPFRALELCGAPPGVGGDCAGIRAGTVVGYDVMLFADPEMGD